VRGGARDVSSVTMRVPGRVRWLVGGGRGHARSRGLEGLGDAPVGDVDLLGDDAARQRRRDGLDVVGEQGLAGVVLGEQEARGGIVARHADEAHGASRGRLRHAVAPTDGDRRAREADLVLELERPLQLQRLLLLAELCTPPHTHRHQVKT